MKCSECLGKPCESPYNDDGECLSPNTLLQAIATGSQKLVQVLTSPKLIPWWVRHPWANSIQEVWEEEDNER